MRIIEKKRSELKPLLIGNELRGGKMLKVAWTRLTDKKVKDENGSLVVVEPAGSLISRRLILRSDWTKATPSGNFEPKGGVMFNAKSKAKAQAISATNQLFLFLSLEGVTHPEGEKDHPVNVPLSRVVEIEDTRDNVVYRIVD